MVIKITISLLISMYITYVSEQHEKRKRNPIKYNNFSLLSVILLMGTFFYICISLLWLGIRLIIW